MAERAEPRELTERLSSQIGTLQESSYRLTSASNLKDLAARFSAVLSQAFRSADLELLFHRDGATRWQVLSGAGSEKPLETIPLPDRPVDGSVGGNGTELSVVQRLMDHSHLAIRLCRNGMQESYDDSDLISLRLHAHLFDVGYQALLSRRTEKDLIFSLNHRVLQLNSLIDTGIEVTKLDQDIPPHHFALQRAASLTNASKGVVTVTAEGKGTERYMFPAAISDEAAILDVSHIMSSFSFGGSTYTFELFEKESRSGVIPFEETDQLLLNALARQVEASLENHYLHAQALEKQKIEQDIAVAASIQQRILPTTLPVIDGYDVAGVNIPSKSVGGDYYDCVPLPDGRFALVVADVAGKGVPAALLVSSFHAFLSAYLESTVPLLEIARNLNRVICRASTEDKFITGFLALLDPATGQLETLNAGHTPGFLLKADGTMRQLNTGGIPFGMLEIDFPFQSELAVIAPGERLLLYTDGVTEAANDQYELYDTAHPLHELFERQRSERADDFIRTLIADIRKFTGSAPQNDDITALYLLRR